MLAGGYRNQFLSTKNNSAHSVSGYVSYIQSCKKERKNDSVAFKTTFRSNHFEHAN